MSHAILDKIISYKKNWLSDQKNKFPLHILKSKLKTCERNFYHTLFYCKNQLIFILEYKRSTPSTGIIDNHSDPIKIAHIYKDYATIISVVTDEKFFQGNFNILSQISDVVTQPILCKDFIISEWQIYFARLHKADAILLILSVLDDHTYSKLSNLAHSLHMGVLTEISNENELKRAIYLDAKVIGINNRNLHDFSIDLNRTIILSENIPDSIITISESGITNYHHIRKLRPYVNGFLIGRVLMSQKKLNTAIKKLIFGENKICGITRSEDANISYKSGAIYGGLIFINHSLRYVDIVAASRIVFSIQHIDYVGVFYNEIITNIINIVKILDLYAVQLHGTENQDYINKLRIKLPTTCQIWKGINMNTQPLPTCNLLNVDRYLLDNGGGSGKTFNWSYLKGMKLNQSILAGGLTVNNCKEASQLGCLGLDFNSGIEIKPGIKNHQKLIKVFQILRAY